MGIFEDTGSVVGFAAEADRSDCVYLSPFEAIPTVAAYFSPEELRELVDLFEQSEDEPDGIALHQPLAAAVTALLDEHRHGKGGPVCDEPEHILAAWATAFETAAAEIRAALARDADHECDGEELP